MNFFPFWFILHGKFFYESKAMAGFSGGVRTPLREICTPPEKVAPPVIICTPLEKCKKQSMKK